VVERKSLDTVINNKPLGRRQVTACLMKAAPKPGRGCALYFHCPQHITRQGQHQVDFRAGRGAVKTCICPPRRGGQQRLNDEPFPTSPRHRVAENLLQPWQTQQRVHNAAVAHINLGRFHQPLAGVVVPGRQTTHQQQIHQQIEVTGNGLAVHAQRACQIGGIQ